MNMGHLRGMERVRYYSRFRHAKYEVTAPNLSTTKAKQLRGLSLCLPPHWSEVRAHCRNTTMSTSAMIVMHHGTNVRGGPLPLADGSLSRTHIMSGSRCGTTAHGTVDLREGCPSSSGSVSSRTGPLHGRQQDMESSNASFRTRVSAESKGTNTTSIHLVNDKVIASSTQSKCATSQESDSGSSIDFLFLASSLKG